MERDRLFSKIILSLVLIFLFNCLVFEDSIYAEDSSQQVVCSIKVKGFYNYDKAFEVLDILNEKRREMGLFELTMDARLLDAAMRRSMESAVIFSHSRPDNTVYYSLDREMIWGENIAAGRDTSYGTFEQWWNSPGHRKNMLSEEFKSIGIGCVQINGIYYWSQEFGFAVSEKAYGGTNKDNVLDINARISNLNMYVNGGDINQTTGKTVRLEVYNRNKVFTYASVKIENSSLAWRSDNINVASVTPNGVIKCLSEGGATIYATLKGTDVVIAKWNVTLTGNREFEEDDLDEDGIIKVAKSKVAKVKKLKKNKLKLTFKKVKKADGYEVIYSKKASMKTVKIKKANKTTVTIKRFSKGKVMYVKVRAYKRLSNGMKVYSEWSKKTKVVL